MYVWLSGEQTQINIMGNVNEPYMASNRFEVAFTSTPPRFRLELTIVGSVRQTAYLFMLLVVVRPRELKDTSPAVLYVIRRKNDNFELCRCS